MREIVFALEFRGHGAAVPGSTTKRRARTTASSQTLTTMLGADGVRAHVDPLGGDSAVLEARVERFGDGTFVEEGSIAYGAAGTVTFATVGRGWVTPAPAPGAMYGGVLWTVTGGDGRLAGARGLIASNFTVSADGEVVDNHFARLYLP